MCPFLVNPNYCAILPFSQRSLWVLDSPMRVLLPLKPSLSAACSSSHVSAPRARQPVTISTAGNPPRDRYGVENPTALSKHDQLPIQTRWTPDLLPAPVRGNIHRQTPCVDSGPEQQDGHTRGASSHTAHRGDEHDNPAFTEYFLHRGKS